MQAKHRGHDYYEVVDGDKWWTLILATSGTWVITNHRGQQVRQDGALGKKLFAAIRVEA